MVDKGAVTFGSSVNSRIFLIGSKPRNDRGFSWFSGEVVSIIRQLLDHIATTASSARGGIFIHWIDITWSRCLYVCWMGGNDKCDICFPII